VSCSLLSCFSSTQQQKYHMKALWPISSGRTQIPRKRTSRYHRGMNPRKLVDAALIPDPEELDIPLVLASSTSFWIKTTCHIFFEPINSVWRATRPYSTNTFLLSGRHRIIATDVEIQLAFLKSVQAVPCSSTSSRRPQKTSVMARPNRLLKMLAERYAYPASWSFTSILLIDASH